MSTYTVLPPHAPCGADFLGEMISATAARCAEIRRFRRCTCKPDPRNKNRGSPSCDACHGAGYVVLGKRPGCGAISKVCRHCGLRAIWDDGPCEACAQPAI